MVSLKTKRIKNKDYVYAEHSFRLPNGDIKKISKLVKTEEEAKSKKVNDYFLEKELDSNKSYALSRYKPDLVITKDKIAKIEGYKVEYRYLLRKLTKKQLSDILDRFTINFTYESNAIEGNSLTLKDVTMILSEEIVPKGKDLREVYETRNTRIANELLFRNKIRINKKGVIELHKLLVKDTGIKTGYKQLPNFLLMRDVKTVPPEKVDSEMEKLFKWYESAKEKDHPLKIASEFHGRFERIHPFEDGNGRVGRVLINAILLDLGYPPVIIRKTTRQAYFSALEAHDNGFSPKLERFLLEKFEDTFEKFFKIYVEYI